MEDVQLATESEPLLEPAPAPAVKKKKPVFRRAIQGKSFNALFDQIASCYWEFKERLSYPLSATSPDENARRPLRTDLLTNWVIDVEHAVTFACRDHPGMDEVVALLFQEAAGLGKADLSAGLRHQTIQRVGYVFSKRGLGVRRYFTTTKTRAERRT